MALVQVYQCDYCHKHINDPSKGLVIKGIIWHADPASFDSVKNNSGNPIVQAKEEETVFCLTCFENKVRSMGNNSCLRSISEKSNYPRLVK